MKSKELETAVIPTTEQDARKSAEEMDEQRHKTLAYEYLCHLEEAKIWMEACLHESLPPTTELEENLRNGVFLAKLGHFMAPEILPKEKIYDVEQRRYSVCGLQFRHTDNINHFLTCLKSMKLPLTFQPETTDIYDKKNMPRVIYCIHALSTHLFKIGKAPQIQDLFGKVDFTDEEINAVSNELKKYGINMPAFQKIGGLLTNSMAGDTAALHAAVIAINQALCVDGAKEMLTQLQNSTAQMKNVNPKHANLYYDVLRDATDLKVQSSLNRSLNDSYVPDAYDELLTQAEIQGHINNVNVFSALEKISDSVRFAAAKVAMNLQEPALELQRIIPENNSSYQQEILPIITSSNWKNMKVETCQHWPKQLQGVIDHCNDIAVEAAKCEEVVKKVNVCLRDGNEEGLHKVLMDKRLRVSHYVDEFALPLYMEEMLIDQQESKRDLTLNDILVSIRVLTSIAEVSKAVDSNNPQIVHRALRHPDAHIAGVDSANKVKYYRALKAVREENFKNHCSLLTYMEIQEAVDLVNQQSEHDSELVEILEVLNTAVFRKDRRMVMKILNDSSSKFGREMSAIDSSLYLKLLRERWEQKKMTDDTGLWLDDVYEVQSIVSEEVSEVKNAWQIMAQLNTSLSQNQFLVAMSCIQELGLKMLEDNKMRYFKALAYKAKKKLDNYQGIYLHYVTKRGHDAYLDVEKQCYTWDLPEKCPESTYITKGDIESVLREIDGQEMALHPSKDIDNFVTRFQACIRGYLSRKKLSGRFDYFHDNIDKIIKLQAWWKAVLQRKLYEKILEAKKLEAAADQLQKLTIDDSDPMSWYTNYEKQIIKIQALWRGRLARKAFHSLLRLDKPPFSAVRHFSAILNFNAEDYDKDLQLQQLKNEVVQLIKHNKILNQQLDSMDIKIGLLIQNRITLQDVIAHGKNLESLTKDKNSNRINKHAPFHEASVQRGLKSLTKGGRRMLEGYQHLFYALQTHPMYLAKLLFLLPQSKSTKFLQNVILTLFNFGSNLREEYLLLKLLGTALREEIRCKFQKPSEVVTGNPLVLKMAVNYARQLNGQRALREILGPIIEKILADKSIAIETNPVDIYKCWRNQLEMETGETLTLPYTVTQHQALQYSQVQKRLNYGIEILQKTVLELLGRITSSRDQIPYGMLYMAKVLHDTLKEKFPNAHEKDILKVVGNLIYYHFINAAIVAPDAFDIITLPVDRSLSNDQRRNLASIAKILQFAASKKGFGEEATHLTCLNSFIIECHEKFKTFFRHCCDIEELDTHFSIHEYTEATLIHKPEIYISLQEICDTHSLVLEYQDQIAPDPLDPLHELLDDLGSTPTISSLLGLDDAMSDSNIMRLGKTEVCLVLNNKFEVPENDDTNLSKLFIKTKELLVSVLQFLKGDMLVEALEATSSTSDEQMYGVLQTAMVSSPKSVQSTSSLDDCKLQLRSYLNKLELGGWVSQADGYQTIVTAVARDLCNKGKYRILRNKELQTLKITKQCLEEKSNYYKEQVEYYNEYIQQCLENLNTGKGTLAVQSARARSHGKLRSKTTLKYSAAKLHEKGVLLKVEGLPQTYLKNVAFEISPTDHNGKFTVKGKFMGVEMEKVDIDIQQLLELQFEGSPIMDMFGKAKINVNLLLFLLNRKFYGKK